MQDIQQQAQQLSESTKQVETCNKMISYLKEELRSEREEKERVVSELTEKMGQRNELQEALEAAQVALKNVVERQQAKAREERAILEG